MIRRSAGLVAACLLAFLLGTPARAAPVEMARPSPSTNFEWPARLKPTDPGALPPGATLDRAGHRIILTAPFMLMPIDFDGWYLDIDGTGLAVFIDPLFRSEGAGRVLQGGYNGGNPSLLVIGGRVDETGHNTRFESGFVWKGTGDATFLNTTWTGATLDYGSWYGSGKLELIGGRVGAFCLSVSHDAHCEPFHIFSGKAWFRRVTWDMSAMKEAIAGGLTAPSVFAEGYSGPIELRMEENVFIGTDLISSPPNCAARCTAGTLYTVQASSPHFPVHIEAWRNRFIPGTSGHVFGLSEGKGGKVTIEFHDNVDARDGKPLRAH